MSRLSHKKRGNQEQNNTPELNKQHSLTDESFEAPPTPLYKIILKRFFCILATLILLVVIYLLLLIAEPVPEKQDKVVNEKIITQQMTTLEAPGESDLSLIADRFGFPILILNGGAVIQSTKIEDNPYLNGYARHVIIRYTLENQFSFTLESIRPTAAISTLFPQGYHINASKLYSMAGMDTGRMDSNSMVCFFAQSDEVSYAFTFEKTSESKLLGLLPYIGLQHPPQKN